MISNMTETYDVIIMGAGLAGLCQARYLMLKVPGLKIAIIDPRSPERSEKDLKIGESTVEIASLFLFKELALHEYLIENHAPKIGLNFHWPKDAMQTGSIQDYYSVWTNRQPPINSYQINRARFEEDVLQMNRDMGVEFIQGRVIDVDLTPQDELNGVKVKVGEETKYFYTKHLIDAAGRKFIIGKKTDNLLFGPENLMGLNNGATWVRVKNVDRSIFHDGYDPYGATSSHYYGTNHFFGKGHWMWMIPLDTRNHELSIGIMHHHDVLPASKVNTKEKFLGFLEKNHNVIYKLIQSGEEIDYHYLPRPAHKSKKMFSEDNWYVIGDAAYIFDAFYSYGSTTVALAIEGVTEVIRAQKAGEADVEKKRKIYNDFNLAYARTVNGLYREHHKQLGHASTMSWRIYFEYMWWFGMMIPMYIGKWHLDPKFLKTCIKVMDANITTLFANVYQSMNKLVDINANIGFMDCYRADQLIGDYYATGYFEKFLANTKLEPKHCDIFLALQKTCFYVAIWYIKFQWKAFGVKGLLAPQSIYNILRLLWLSFYSSMGGTIHKLETLGTPDNTQIAAMRQQFDREYRYTPGLVNWDTPSSDNSNSEDRNRELLPLGK